MFESMDVANRGFEFELRLEPRGVLVNEIFFASPSTTTTKEMKKRIPRTVKEQSERIVTSSSKAFVIYMRQVWGQHPPHLRGNPPPFPLNITVLSSRKTSFILGPVERSESDLKLWRKDAAIFVFVALFASRQTLATIGN